MIAILAFGAILAFPLPAVANATWQSLGALSSGSGPADQPQVAVDAGGDSVYVWRRSDGATDCFGGPCLRIQARFRSAAGVLSSIQTLSPSGQHGALPQVAVAATGNAVFVWQRSDGMNLRIQTRVRSAAGILGPTLTLSAAGQDASNPQVAVDGNGNALFAWERFDGASERIQARTMSPDGTRGSTLTLSPAGGDALNAQVAVDPHGNAIFAWERWDGANERIQTRARSAAGTLSATQTLSAAGEDASSVSVAADPNANAVFAWKRFDGTADRIQDRARSAAGVLSATQTLSDAGKHAYEPRVAVDAGGNAVVLWQRFDGLENRVQTRARSAAGVLSATQTLDGTGTATGVRAQLAVDAQGTAVIVWERREGTAVCCMRFEALVRSAAGTLGAIQTLSAAGEDAQEPHVSVDSNHHAFTVWQERTNGRVHAAVGSY